MQAAKSGMRPPLHRSDCLQQLHARAKQYRHSGGTKDISCQTALLFARRVPSPARSRWRRSKWCWPTHSAAWLRLTNGDVAGSTRSSSAHTAFDSRTYTCRLPHAACPLRAGNRPGFGTTGGLAIIADTSGLLIRGKQKAVHVRPCNPAYTLSWLPSYSQLCRMLRLSP